MYRYICIDFGYLSVIVSSPGLNLYEALSWTGVNLYPFPITESARTCLFSLFLPLFVSAHHHLTTCLRSPDTSFHKPHVIVRPLVRPCCVSVAWSQALNISAYRLRLEAIHTIAALTTAYRTCLAHSITKWIKTLQSLGHFLPVQWKCNVMWSYA